MKAPSIDRLLTMTCDVFHRVETVESDGDITTTDTPELDVPCYVERSTVLEQRAEELVVIANWRGFFAPEFVAEAPDYLVLVSGPKLEFVGPTLPIWNAREAYVHHVEARLREVD